MPMLQDNLDTYAKLNTEPCQMGTLLSLAVMDARNAKEKKDNMLTEEDFFTNADALKSLEHIKKRFNIKIDEEFFNSDQQLFKSFLDLNPHAFFSFKNHANIGRTLSKHNFKPKVKTGIEKRRDNVIQHYD